MSAPSCQQCGHTHAGPELLDSCTSVDGLLEGVSGLFEIAAETLNRVQPTMRMGGE